MRPTNRSVGRRQFLRRMIGAGTGISLFSILPRHVLGGPNETAPSDVIRFAVIGQGGMGRSAAGGYISPEECKAKKKSILDSL